MKKNEEAGGTSPLKERLIGSEKIGRRSSRRAPAMAISCPWTSQTMTSPVQPQNSVTRRRTTPEIQASARGPQV